MSKGTDAVEKVRELIDDLESASAYNTKEIENCLDALASAIWTWKGKGNHQPKHFSDSIQVLPFDKKLKRLLVELYDDIQSSIEGADYDDDDDQAVEMLSNLIADFYYTFDEALRKHEP